ncbi:ergosterol biosynthesis ERG4/ERG24 [Leptodontidium sp. 2 PMI_412]|nr:ergosterol biosynthesis ERG4/ERG24 [Leptodontidium sp. 2 PMI_412]
MATFGPVEWFSANAPQLSMNVSLGYFAWVMFQAAIYQYLPVRNLSMGQLTPAGNILEYRTNGLGAWIISHCGFLALSYFGYVNPAILARNWQSLLLSLNVYGFLLSAFAYWKAHAMPSHQGDRKFGGSVWYDFYMGIELNPRLNNFDVKLFTNGRPGIVAWTIIDLSFVAYQYQLHGYITNSILIATYLHGLYVIDFFINEDWYVRTIDIAHDHFGFYLAWGSTVWLPAMYTLQTQYLARCPVTLSMPAMISLTIGGTGGYALFRSVNNQKHLTRRTQGDCLIWGTKAKILKMEYKTGDGLTHQSVMLISGWWGLARHTNYLGDLILSYSMCATCGFHSLLPWTYAIFMTILLVHRCWRDEDRCLRKYGKAWRDYCELVKWRIIPGVW